MPMGITHSALCLLALLAVPCFGTNSSDSTNAVPGGKASCEAGCPVEFQPVCTDRGHTVASPCIAKCSGAQVVMQHPCPGEALLHEGNTYAIPPGISHDSESKATRSRQSPRIWSHDVMSAYSASGYIYLGQMGLLQYSHMRRSQPQQSSSLTPSAHNRSWASWIKHKIFPTTQANISHSFLPHIQLASLITDSDLELPPDGRRLRLLRITSNGHLYVRDLELPNAHVEGGHQATGTGVSTGNEAISRSTTTLAELPMTVGEAVHSPKHIASKLTQHLLCKKEAGGLSTLDEQLLATLVGPILDSSMTGKCKQDEHVRHALPQYTGDVLPWHEAQQQDNRSTRSGTYPKGSVAGQQPGAKRRKLGVFPPDHRISCPRFPTYPFSAVGQIEFQDADKPYICSGTLIGPDVVITAAHCVWNRMSKAFFGNIAFSAARFLSSTSAGIISPLGTLTYTHADIMYGYVNDTTSDPNQYDIAVLKLPAKIGYKTGWMGIRPACSLLWDSAFMGTTAGYPTDRASGSCVTSQCPITQKGCYFPLLFHMCDTVTGQSGSAIWQSEVGRDNQPAAYVRGVHNVEWTNSSGMVFTNAGVAIVPDYEVTIKTWIVDSFTAITQALGAPSAAVGLQPGDPFQGTGLGADLLQQLATQV